jgi:hypothetical protein
VVEDSPARIDWFRQRLPHAMIATNPVDAVNALTCEPDTVFLDFDLGTANSLGVAQLLADAPPKLCVIHSANENGAAELPVVFRGGIRMPDFFSRLSALWSKSASRTGGARTQSHEKFSVFKSEMDGHPLIATIDVGLHGYESKASLPWFLSLSTRLIEPTKDGLPTPGDSIALNEWEDLVEKRIAAVCPFVYVGHVTWNGSREVLYYIERDEPAASVLRKLRDDRVTRPFAFLCERDDEWDKTSIYFKQSN